MVGQADENEHEGGLEEVLHEAVQFRGFTHGEIVVTFIDYSIFNT